MTYRKVLRGMHTSMENEVDQLTKVMTIFQRPKHTLRLTLI